MENFDLVIVGAGSAGCIVTNQLINNTSYKILLIEAGPTDINPIIKIPLGYGMTFYHPKLNWNFYSKKQININNREIYTPRGKVIGGSGSINAMVYARGLESDYEDWNMINKNWSWNSIREIYKIIEHKVSLNDHHLPINKIPVNDVSNFHHPILKYYFNASKELGIPFNKNLNTSIKDQVGHYNINTFRGYRASSSSAFLHPIKNNERLKILSNCKVKKINIDGNKIKDLEIVINNKKYNIKPNIGTILSCGSIMTPKLLLNSGIGNGEELQKLNIKVNLHSPQVGKNLQDHFGIDYLYKSRVSTLNQSLGTWLGRFKSFSTYLYNRRGPFSLSLNQAGGYINWNSLDKYPNLQLYFNPLTYSVSHKNKRPLLQTDKFNGFIIGFNSCRPKSLGSVSLASPEYNADPLIDPNYLSDEKDIHDLYAAFDYIRKISKTKSMRKIINKPVNINPLINNDKEMLEHFKSNATTVYHPCGTCRIDDDIQKGVVSTKLKVNGTENLWIVDSSILPNITSGNINAPVMMLAYLCSKTILEDLKKKN